MSKFRVVAQLDLYVDRQLAWRKKELTRSKFLIEKASNTDKGILRRACIALMYAHWEGYVKDAGRAYIRFLNEQSIDLENASTNLLAISMLERIRMAAKSQRPSSQHSLVREIRDQSGVLFSANSNKVIRTRSNLNWERTEDILDALGLDKSEYLIKSIPIIEKLVNLRNNVAHGSGMRVDHDTYFDLHSGIIFLMGHFRDQLSNAASTKSYLSA